MYANEMWRHPVVTYIKQTLLHTLVCLVSLYPKSLLSPNTEPCKSGDEAKILTCLWTNNLGQQAFTEHSYSMESNYNVVTWTNMLKTCLNVVHNISYLILWSYRHSSHFRADMNPFGAFWECWRDILTYPQIYWKRKTKTQNSQSNYLTNYDDIDIPHTMFYNDKFQAKFLKRGYKIIQWHFGAISKIIDQN